MNSKRSASRSVPDNVVRQIRDLRGARGFSYRELARMYGISERMICDICLGRSYRDIE